MSPEDRPCPNISIPAHGECSHPICCPVQVITPQPLTWDHLMDTAKEEVC